MTDSIPLCFSTQVWFYCTAMFGSLPCWKMKFLAKRGFQDRKANAAQTMRRPLPCLTDSCRYSLLYLWPDVLLDASLCKTCHFSHVHFLDFHMLLVCCRGLFWPATSILHLASFLKFIGHTAHHAEMYQTVA